LARPRPQRDLGAAEAGAVARLAAVGALALAIVVVAVLLLRGGGGHSYRIVFQNAGQLVKGDDVQVGGRRVGSVKQISLTNDNLAEIRVGIEAGFGALHRGTTAIVRATSLSGIANRYIALTPGPNSARTLADGSRLGIDSTTSIVDLDQLFNALDPPTRKHLQDVVQGFATQYQGQGQNTNLSSRYFNPALSTTDRLVSEVTRDQPALTQFLARSSQLVSDLADRRDDLSGLVANANGTAAAIARENAAFDQALRLLPGTLRKANTTFVNLRATLDDLDVLVSAAKPATKRLRPLLANLRPLVASARPTIRDLRRLVGTPGPNNDLTDAVNKLPALSDAAHPALVDTTAALRRAQPVADFIRPYAPELVGWFRDFGQDAANYDANGHFARIQPIINAFSINTTGFPFPDTLVPIPTADRLTGTQQGNLRRCPGAASQAPPDNSAPFRDTGGLDCDPTRVPPGP
jgi:phospholipid/cholesterol/gamma-HCH transport system substrate-binding protein